MHTKVIKSFSQAAMNYDEIAHVQPYIAGQLLREIESYTAKNGQPKKILDIGCGTGQLSYQLADIFPGTHITAIDASGDMIQQARQKKGSELIDWQVQSLESVILPKETYDLIVSNASLQWVSDISLGISKIKDALTMHGACFFSFFGPDTFKYLQEAFSHVFQRDIKMPAHFFLSSKELNKCLSDTFGVSSSWQLRMKVLMPSILSLLQHIKEVGMHGHGITPKVMLRPHKLKALESYYQNKCAGVIADYHVFCFKVSL